MSHFDIDALLANELVIGKLDAARRQIESAIDLLFRDGDVVSQHTLTSAAHGIVYDLARQRGISGSIKESPLIQPAERAAFCRAINSPQNFFKHADKDADGRLVFRFEISPLYLFDAVRLYVLLSERLTRPMQVFLLWFQLRFPELLCFPPAEVGLAEVRASLMTPSAFKVLARQLLAGEGEIG